MRQCPHCHHLDPAVWRHKRFRLFTDYCHIDELKTFDVELWKCLLDARIETEKQVKVGFYIYHLTKARYIDRIHYLDSLDGNSWREPEQEKHKCRISTRGQKLLFQTVDGGS